jgi:O-antigen ligase
MDWVAFFLALGGVVVGVAALVGMVNLGMWLEERFDIPAPAVIIVPAAITLAGCVGWKVKHAHDNPPKPECPCACQCAKEK